MRGRGVGSYPGTFTPPRPMTALEISAENPSVSSWLPVKFLELVDFLDRRQRETKRIAGDPDFLKNSDLQWEQDCHR